MLALISRDLCMRLQRLQHSNHCVEWKCMFCVSQQHAKFAVSYMTNSSAKGMMVTVVIQYPTCRPTGWVTALLNPLHYCCMPGATMIAECSVWWTKRCNDGCVSECPTKHIIGHIGDGFLRIKWPNQQCHGGWNALLKWTALLNRFQRAVYEVSALSHVM